MQENISAVNPEDEVLEGVIVEDDETPLPVLNDEEILEEGSEEVSGFSNAKFSTPLVEDSIKQRQKFEETGHQNMDEINRVALEAHSYKANSLEETTANINNLKNLLKRYL